MPVIVAFGDSNTWGYDPATGSRFPRPQRWPSVLQRELGADFEVIAEGLNGRTTVHDDPIEPYRCGAERSTALPDDPCAAGPRHPLARLQRLEEAIFRFRLRHRRRRGAPHLSRSRLRARPGRPPAENPARSRRPRSPSSPTTRKCSRAAGKSPFSSASVIVKSQSARASPSWTLAPVIRCSDLDGIHYEADQHELLGTHAAAKVGSRSVLTRAA